MKRKLVFALIAVIVFTVNITQTQAGTIESEDYGDKITITNAEPIKSAGINCKTLIKDMVESIQNKDWENYMELMSYEEREFYNSYFNNDSYRDGIKQI